MDRASFLARLAAAGGRISPEPRGQEAWPRPGDPLAAFREGVLASGAGFHQAAGAPQAVELALALLGEAGAGRVGVHDLGPELAAPLERAAPGMGLELVRAPDQAPGAVELIEPLPAGITRPELAIAAPAGLLQAARPGGGRLLSLLPPLHIALLPASAILASLADLPAALADPARFPAGPPAAFSLIAGPSKTGDIEAVMVRGVHGPGRLEIILWPA